MKIDIFKVLNVINMGMDIAEQLRHKKGAEKLVIAKDSAGPLIMQLEGLVGKDLLKEERIAPLVDEYIAIVVKLSKAVAEVKALKADPAPAA